ncbi:MAG: SusE domain-containing protein [Bacteroidetes bacterium]|nr:SusE domain-containing protein [Bacteroidota bacterium]
MKKILILILALGLIAFYSCKKDETKATLSASPNASVLNLTSGAQIILKKSDSGQLITYSWSASQFGQVVVIGYTVEMDMVGNSFKNAIPVVQSSNALSASINTYDFNQKILPMEYDPKNPTPINLEFRVKAVINANIDPLYSAVVPQTITPYFVKIVYPILFVPGSYQGWNPADSSTVVTSKSSNGQFEGYIWFGTDQVLFKYTQKPNWDINWGDDGADGTLNPGGANIQAGLHGYYKLNVDLPNLTHKFLLTAWSIIGDATSGGWNTDTDMKYDSISKTWSVTTGLTAAGLKFRANHAWDLNYGDDGSNTGKLSVGGANIAVPAGGNYTVILNLSQPIYKYQLKKN